MRENRPVPGVRRRRHEAAREALERHGWRQAGPVRGDTRHYRHEGRPKHELIVGSGGALYWCATNRSRILRQAGRRDGDDVAAALDAARQTR